MKLSTVFHQLGKLLMFISAAMVFSLFWAVYDKSDDIKAIAFSMIIIFVIGLLQSLVFKKGSIGYKESILLVAFAWLSAIIFGALPYIFYGSFSLADAIFESTSGFTTTGASILSDIEALPRGLLFWRSQTQWLGGLGIMILFVALMSQSGIGAVQIFNAEYTTAYKEKLVPRVKNTAKILCLTYLAVSLAEFLIFYLLGMGLFDSIAHTFSTVATGGFSTKNASIGFYQSAAIHWAFTIFMLIGGVSFFLYYHAFRDKSLSCFIKNSEFKCYLTTIIVLTCIVTVSVYPQSEDSMFAAITSSAFHLVSLITGTGFAVSDYDVWPVATKTLLVLVMFIGGCAGSTTGSIKIIRWMVLFKQTFLEFKKLIHPRAVLALKFQEKAIEESMIIRTLQFFFLFIITFAIGALALTMMGMDFVSSATASAAALTNVGPGLATVGPVLNYSHVPTAGKYLLSFLMVLGRLELYTVLVLFIPEFWNLKRKKRSF